MKQIQYKQGDTISYNDGREGHKGVKALVLGVNDHGMLVQFEDRADTDSIKFHEDAWMKHISKV